MVTNKIMALDLNMQLILSITPTINLKTKDMKDENKT